ncbi:glycoside hydrolase family 5 protein [Sphingomonas sp. R-74633]|uniref:glycoside hydrolase family 5 protein n=1 Tax=Sphingomonas sp. R-74633 TaxID=2751188 RepID=UPI00211E3B41|nr:glycoside hydrolase family 5 protein [Sphingomonas sp. R-74633]
MRLKAFSSFAVLALVACSGGSASAGGGGATSVTPTPTASASPTPTPTPSAPVYTAKAAFVPTTGISLPIGKCVNMGNHLEAPNEGDWGRAIVDNDFTIIKTAGFNTVRVPVRWSTHALAAAPYTIDAAWMARVRHVVDTARAAGLNVILNVHHYEEMATAPAAHAVRFAEIWKQVAAEFASEPTASVWFELMNEPNGALNDTNLQAILAPALANVRATNPTRPVIIGGQGWSGVDSLATVWIPSDPYVVATIHTYDPFAFTHQGATYVTPTPPLGRVFGSAADYAELNANLAKVQAYMSRTGRSVFVGEYGVHDDPAIPLSERVKYYGTITSAYASIGVQSCAWAYTNTFKLRDGSAWLPGMVEAIQTTTTLQ